MRNYILYCYEVTNDHTGECFRHGLVSARSGAEAIGHGLRVARNKALTAYTVKAYEVMPLPIMSSNWIEKGNVCG